MWKHKKWFAYILYSLVLCVALLYYRFPSKAFRNYLQESFTRAAPRFSLSIHRVSPCLSFGMRLEEIKLSRRLEPDLSLFKVRSLVIRPRLRSFLRGKKVFCFDGSAYGGHLKGCAGAMTNRKETPLSLSLELNGLQMETFEGLQRLIGRRVKGSVSGTLSFIGKTDSLVKGSGEARLSLAKGEMELLQPVLGLKSLKFDKIGIYMTLKRGRVKLASAEMEGPDMKGSLRGTVVLNKELLKSRLDLKGSVEPRRRFYQTLAGNPLTSKFFKEHAKRGKLPFAIRGAIKKPGLQFI